MNADGQVDYDQGSDLITLSASFSDRSLVTTGGNDLQIDATFNGCESSGTSTFDGPFGTVEGDTQGVLG